MVDGNVDPIMNDGSCSNTNDGPGGPNWLMVDLQMIHNIGYVVMVNRGDSWGEFLYVTIWMCDSMARAVKRF